MILGWNICKWIWNIHKRSVYFIRICCNSKKKSITIPILTITSSQVSLKYEMLYNLPNINSIVKVLLLIIDPMVIINNNEIQNLSRNRIPSPNFNLNQPMKRINEIQENETIYGFIGIIISISYIRESLRIIFYNNNYYLFINYRR